MANSALKLAPKKEQAKLLARERQYRQSGDWGEWEALTCLPGSVGPGSWTAFVTRVHRNRVFAVLERRAEAGVLHLAVSSLSGIRPTWWEMQRIKNELAGEEATAIEIYPPQKEVVDGADMFHIWVLRGKVPFGLYTEAKHPALDALRGTL